MIIEKLFIFKNFANLQHIRRQNKIEHDPNDIQKINRTFYLHSKTENCMIYIWNSFKARRHPETHDGRVNHSKVSFRCNFCIGCSTFSFRWFSVVTASDYHRCHGIHRTTAIHKIQSGWCNKRLFADLAETTRANSLRVLVLWCWCYGVLKFRLSRTVVLRLYRTLPGLNFALIMRFVREQLPRSLRILNERFAFRRWFFFFGWLIIFVKVMYF